MFVYVLIFFHPKKNLTEFLEVLPQHFVISVSGIMRNMRSRGWRVSQVGVLNHFGFGFISFWHPSNHANDSFQTWKWQIGKKRLDFIRQWQFVNVTNFRQFMDRFALLELLTESESLGIFTFAPDYNWPCQSFW